MSNRGPQQSVGLLMKQHLEHQQRSREPSSSRKGPPTRPKPTSKTRNGGRNNDNGNAEKEPIDVYCRIRRLDDQSDLTCVRGVSNTVARLSDPRRPGKKDIDYTFKQVFCENANQKDVFEEVAQPLVKDLVDGKNALLFTYGITGSGKTFTMTGEPGNPGIVPRTLDVLFQSIKNNIQMKHTFKPNGSNGFYVRNHFEALAACNDERVKNATSSAPSTPILAPRTPRQRRHEELIMKDWMNREKTNITVELENTNHGYSVFVSYVQIYGKFIYDLLDEAIHPVSKQPECKNIRSDDRGSSYVHNIKEIEVSTADEAFELFLKGNRKRKNASTALNSQSSRSHSIFNIRVVQARRLELEIIQDENNVPIVSQLSLVDLAGSERSNRTGAEGKTQQEAGNINNSLAALKRLIRTLRNNQKNGTKDMFAYRTDKLTQLFQTNFEGNGKIRMIICINPSADNYEETIGVMEFAGYSQEVMISRGVNAFKYNAGLNFFNGETNGIKFAERNFGPPPPQSNYLDPNDEKAIPDWIEYMEERKRVRNEKKEFMTQFQMAFRERLELMERDYLWRGERIKTLENDVEGRYAQLQKAEEELERQKSEANMYKKQVENLERENFKCIEDVKASKQEVRRMQEDRRRLEIRFRDEIESEKVKIKMVYDHQLNKIVKRLRAENCLFKDKIGLVEQIFFSDRQGVEQIRSTISTPIDLPSSSESNAPRATTPTGSPSKRRSGRRPASEDILDRSRKTARHRSSPIFLGEDAVFGVMSPQEHPPVVNPRHRRSLSTGNEKWIDHRPPGTLSLGTVMQPKIKNKTSLSNLKKASTETFRNASNYALTHHTADANGEVETQVYKADVIPSMGGGVHVMFNDVETLKQSSPLSPNSGLRKRTVSDSQASADTPVSSVTNSNNNSPTKESKRRRNSRR